MAELETKGVDKVTEAPVSVARMYVVVMSIGVACALAIVVVYETTRPIINRKKIELRNRAVLRVLPAAQTTAVFQLSANGTFNPTSADSAKPDLVFAGYDAANNLVGVAIEARGRGYQDVIEVLYGYEFDSQAIVGMRLLQSRETPGLGDRVETDADFLRNFESLDVSLNSDGTSFAHSIEFVKPSEKQASWQIDGISGATITSRAIAEMLGDSAARWIPIVFRRREDFEYLGTKDNPSIVE